MIPLGLRMLLLAVGLLLLTPVFGQRLALIGASADNAFLAAARELNLTLETSAAPRAQDYDALLICAPDYPQVKPLTDATRHSLEQFLAAGKAVYVEYAPLPGMLAALPQTAAYERLYVPGADLQGDGLAPLSVLEEHSSRYLPFTLADMSSTRRILLSYGRVAGVDRAVFGPPAEPLPALVEFPSGQGRLLVAATALSNCWRGRYKPTRSWAALTRAVLLALLAEDTSAAVRRQEAVRRQFIDLEAWTEPREWVAPGELVHLTVRAAPDLQVQATGPTGALKLTAEEGGLLVSPPVSLGPGTYEWRVTASRGAAHRELTVKLRVSPRQERYRQTVERNLRWFEQAGMLFAPDGSKGVREGLRSELGPDGQPLVAGGLRVDCVSECGLLFRLYGRLSGDAKWLERGNRMLEYTSRAFQVTAQDCWYFGHWQSRGEFRDDGSTIYVFNDDSGAATLFSLLGYASTGDRGQLQAGLRGVEYFCHVASDKSGLFGSMSHRDYEGSGHMGVPWPVLRAADSSDGASPHVMNLPLASLLVAYQLTGEQRYLDLAERGIRTLMTMYPNWHLVTSRTCEHARMLLPLALLNKVAPSAEHRQWLDTVVDFLISKQAPCGALAEWDGCNPANNAAFGTGENSVIQQNGDSISDQLYGTGFALLHLGLAAQVTGDQRLWRAYERLGDYLTRIQMCETEPLHDGTWLRGFDFGRWEYFGSSADVGWGPYGAETGWMCAPLDLGLLVAWDKSQPPLALPDHPDARLLPLARAARQEAEAVEAALTSPPAAVTGLKAQPSRGPYAVLTWITGPVHTLDYRVYRSQQADFAPAADNLVATTNEEHWTDLQLAPTADYYYRVVATNGLGQTGAPSAEVKITTGPLSKARGCHYTKSLPPYPGYPDSADALATDGVYAGPYADRKSYGYRLAELGDAVQVAVTVDLGREGAIGRATHHNCGASGYRPDTMAVSVSRDGQTFTKVGDTDAVARDLMSVDFPETAARFVRFDFIKRRQGSSDDWLFLDELEVF